MTWPALNLQMEAKSDRPNVESGECEVFNIKAVKVIRSTFSIAMSSDDSNGSSTTTRGRRRFRRRQRLKQLKQQQQSPNDSRKPNETILESGMLEVTITNASLLSKNASYQQCEVSSLSSCDSIGSTESASNTAICNPPPSTFGPHS